MESDPTQFEAATISGGEKWMILVARLKIAMAELKNPTSDSKYGHGILWVQPSDYNAGHQISELGQRWIPPPEFHYWGI